MIFIGDGVAYSGAQDELTRVAETAGRRGLGSRRRRAQHELRHPLYMGMTGHMFGPASLPIISKGTPT